MLGNESTGEGGRWVRGVRVPVSGGLLMMIQSHQLNSLLKQGISECLQAASSSSCHHQNKSQLVFIKHSHANVSPFINPVRESLV